MPLPRCGAHDKYCASQCGKIGEQGLEAVYGRPLVLPVLGEVLRFAAVER